MLRPPSSPEPAWEARESYNERPLDGSGCRFMLALPAQSSAPATFTSTGFAELFQRNCGAGRTVFKQQSVSGKTGDITVGDRNWFSQDEMSTFPGVTPGSVGCSNSNIWDSGFVSSIKQPKREQSQ